MGEPATDGTSRVPRRLLYATLAVDAFWVAAYVAMTAAGKQGSKIFAVFDLAGEANPPAWWSSAQLLLIGVALLVLAARPFIEHARLRPLKPALLIAGAAFVFLSADEAGVIHERMTGLLGGLPFIPSINGHGVWIFFYAAIGLALVVLLRGALVHAARAWRREFVLAVSGAGMLVLGAVGFEILGYLWRPALSILALEQAIEEGGELVGQSFILFAVTLMLSSALAALVAGSGGRRADERETRTAKGA